jgi:hypothetical protein
VFYRGGDAHLCALDNEEKTRSAEKRVLFGFNEFLPY